MKAGLPRKKKDAGSLCVFFVIKKKLAPLYILLSLLGVFLFSQSALANNLSISNVALTGSNAGDGYVQVQFDISWDNSWRNQTNWDAVWIFIKYTTETSAPYTWKHATLYLADLTGSATNPSQYSRGSGTLLTIHVPDDNGAVQTDAQYGAFVYRSDIGYGSVSTTSMKLAWNYAADGVSETATATVRVFGIEMVYIPQGSFLVGDSTNSSSNPPGGFFITTGAYYGFTVSTESGMTLGCTGGTCIQQRSGQAVADDFTSAANKNLGASFPKGYNAFYVMKYEITQNQYTSFLNTLERRAQRNRIASTASADSITNYYVMSGRSLLANSNRNTIQAPSVGNGSVNPIAFSVTRPYRAMNYMNWMDLAAYADWAALRPMTELEYEKVARGPVTAHSGEYAWGSTLLYIANIVSSSEDGTEYVALDKSTLANVAYGNVTYSDGDASTGPLRAGIFAKDSSRSKRPLSGAGFYGAMELSGNVAEQVVTIGNSTAFLSTVRGGRNFEGAHGDGVVASGSTCNAAGDADEEWPGNTGGADTNCSPTGWTVDNARGSIRRGGGWASDSTRLRVSDRYDSSSAGSDSRDSNNGGRLARTAP